MLRRRIFNAQINQKKTRNNFLKNLKKYDNRKKL